MKRFYLTVLALVAGLTATAFAGEWSRNNVLKFFAGSQTGNGDPSFRMLDYENIAVHPFHLKASSQTNAWITTFPVFVGDQHILASAFLNLDDSVTDAASFAVLSVRDSTDDRVIQEKLFRRSGRIDLVNVFNKNVYLHLELFGTNVSVLSYGLVRQPEIIMTAEGLRVSPAVLFYDENVLRIQFTLRYPAVLDVILFDRSGKIVETIVKQEFFSEGENYLYWEPSAGDGHDLASGSHLIYFKVRSTDGKTVELTREFLFVRK